MKTVTVGDTTYTRTDGGYTWERDGIKGRSASAILQELLDEIESLRTQVALHESAASAWKAPDHWQKRCVELGFVYTRAPDDHYVDCTQEQAAELLREVLGVDVHFYQAHDLYEDDDLDAPGAIKDRDGRVTLALCKRCGRGEAALGPHCTPAVTDGGELARLRNFKSYVHQRLDEAGVPVDPPSPHREAGCRIGGRLDAVLKPQGFGIACTVAWTELVQALRADGHQVNDNSGPTVRKWLTEVVRDTFLPNAQALQSARRTIEGLMAHHKFNLASVPASTVHEKLALALVQLCPAKTDACTWPDCGHDGNGVGQACYIDLERTRIHIATMDDPQPFTLVPNAEDGDFDCPKAAAARECPCGFCEAMRDTLWKDAVLDALANTGMDAMKSDHPRSILARVLRWHEDAMLQRDEAAPVDQRVVLAFDVICSLLAPLDAIRGDVKRALGVAP